MKNLQEHETKFISGGDISFSVGSKVIFNLTNSDDSVLLKLDDFNMGIKNDLYHSYNLVLFGTGKTYCYAPNKGTTAIPASIGISKAQLGNGFRFEISGI